MMQNNQTAKRTEGLSFGHAIEALKAGHRVARRGWNGKEMSIYLNAGSSADMTADAIDGISIDHFQLGHEGTVTRLPNINMRTASGSTLTGWLASQTDILADDWQIVDEVPSRRPGPILAMESERELANRAKR